MQGLADPVRLDHFLAAQDNGVYDQALEEIRDGEKRSHWMWFVFPQLAGLGTSATAKKYALADRSAARTYAAHEVLGDRLYEATEAMLEWAGAMSAEAILGKVDALKLRSSMTLFEAACADNEPFTQALDAFWDGERDEETLRRL